MSSADTIALALRETANALWKKVLKKEIGPGVAKKIVLALPNTIWLLDESRYMERAFEIAVLQRITVYDALFIACAATEDAKLVSCDKRQLEVARRLGIETTAV